MDRRAVFFVVAALACAALAPLADARHRWVAWALAGLYLVLAAGSLVDSWSRRRRGSPSRTTRPQPKRPVM